MGIRLKTAISILFFCAAVIIWAPSAVRADITAGLMGHWRFDEGSGIVAGDSAGLNPGTLVNGPSWTSGRVGSGAIDFNSANAQITTPSDFLGTGDVTITAWIYPRTFGGSNLGSIVNNGNFVFRVRGGANANYLDYRARNNNLSASAVNSIALNTWQFVTLTRSGTTVNFYVNGVQSGYPNQTNQAPLGGSNVYIGNRQGGDQRFDGMIDDLRIYNRILTPSEIAEVYAYVGSTTTPPADTTPPAISSVATSSVMSTGAVISWQTDEASDTQVEYGLTASYSNTTSLNTAPVTSHSQSIAGLTPDTLYHFRVRSRDAAGNLATSGDYTFTTLPSSPAPEGVIPVNLYLDMEGAPVGSPLTPSILAASTHGGSGTWSVSVNAPTGMRIAANETTLYTPVSVGATTYDDTSGLKGLQADIGTVNSFAEYLFDSEKSAVSMGGFVSFGSIGQSYQTVDHINFVTVDGDFCVAQTSSSFKLRAHTKVGTGPDIAIEADKIYWLTMKFSRNGQCMLEAYDTAAWTKIGESSLSMTSDSPAKFFRFGRTDAHGGDQPPASSADIYEDIILDWTNATFPLGPGTGSTSTPAAFVLTATKTGTGNGTVASSVGGIDCGTACTSSPLVSGTSVTLTANPLANSAFAGWSGGGCSGMGSCVITLTATTTVTAIFDLIPTGPENIYLSQTATGSGAGTSCANARPAAFFNVASNWGAGPGKISEGDNIRFCGFISTPLTVQTSDALGINLYFEP